jgi:dipeptidyl aminopeptidase/acylaminoacyl peptidase
MMEKGTDGEIIYRIRLDDPVPGVSLYDITYWSQGLRVKGLLALPEQLPAPGLVYCRGGIRRVGMVRIDRLIPLASRGFAVFAPFYRGNEGGEGREDFGGDDRYDLYAGIRLLRELPETTEEPIGLIGFSRGALMALAAASECDGIGAVVVWGGVSDLFLTYEERVDLRRMLKRVVGHPVKDAAEYERRSPVCWASRIRVPVLIVHGAADTNVGVEHAHRLARALEDAGKDYTMAVYEERGHVFLKPYEEETIEFMLQWIREHSKIE